MPLLFKCLSRLTKYRKQSDMKTQDKKPPPDIPRTTAIIYNGKASLSNVGDSTKYKLFQLSLLLIPINMFEYYGI